ncbi:MAG: acetylornithine deacetylase, partial [Pseudomonadota bacterium]
AEIVFEFRHLAEDDPDALERSIRDAAQALMPAEMAPDGIRIESAATYPGLSISETHEAVRQAQNWSGTPTCKVGFGTEAGILSEMGIPAVVCGPGSMERHGHKADECISIGQLQACSEMLDTMLLSLR